MKRPRDAWNDGVLYSYIGTKEIFGDTFEFPHDPSIAGKLNLNIGCGTRPTIGEGWINADHIDGKDVDHFFDAQSKWPFEDDTFKAIYCSHMVEHLSDPMAFFKEAYRVLAEGGCMLIRVPHPRSSQALGDFDHKRPIGETSFYFLSMDFESTNNLTHTKLKGLWSTRYMIHAYPEDHWMNKWWIPRSFKVWAVEHLWNVAHELVVWLKPIKGEN